MPGYEGSTILDSHTLHDGFLWGLVHGLIKWPGRQGVNITEKQPNSLPLLS